MTLGATQKSPCVQRNGEYMSFENVGIQWNNRLVCYREVGGQKSKGGNSLLTCAKVLARYLENR
jgi:hypothetical protein